MNCTSIFDSISYLADKREKLYEILNDGKPNDIDILSLLKRYKATHIPISELLNIITETNINLVDNDLEYYCTVLYGWFVPSHSLYRIIYT